MRKELPVTQIVSRKYEAYGGSLMGFLDHVAPLDIKARGDVLIIGAGIWLEELVVIEEDIAAGEITNIKLIGSDARIGFQTMAAYEEAYDIPISVSGLSYGHIFDAEPNLQFDTILCIGMPMAQPERSLKYIAEQLNPSGCLYVTINAFHIPEDPLQIPNCGVKIIPDIPMNPNYVVAGYYGVVVQKSHAEVSV